MNDQKRKIPTNIITGFLGAGKTTAINAMLASKPENESWAILVNEFGQVGIDQEMLPDDDGVYVKEVAGGCMCCSMGASLSKTLSVLIEHASPDRLIIEPTGLGHPEGIMDTLMNRSFKDILDVRATVCLLDPRLLDQEEVISNKTFQDQLSMSDIVLINKCDLAAEEFIEIAETSLNNMFPPKQHVGKTTRGLIDLKLLDVVREGKFCNQLPGSHGHAPHHHHHSDPDVWPEPRSPIKKIGNGSGFYSCGWVFHRSDCFDYWKLEGVLNGIRGINRIKGVIRISSDWVLFNRVQDESDFDKVAYRRDSRVEIISPFELDWEKVEREMLACLIDA
ncbi:GTP-binding protein [Neptuniibacter sp. 1_MG-2023]|uniref:CobW family GTP-binding protein n=1 Tax=Neptuniibacter sp. 1_MG-2023 TaxID=3062662 RepID=UPI0026E2A592|nr:GTP-binding protein [Neptuniibacter sp. 1_MG-2023]MDO6592585.1 GTP-binding protein [Neptuniibacter sp. 1_MG-2023]